MWRKRKKNWFAFCFLGMVPLVIPLKRWDDIKKQRKSGDLEKQKQLTKEHSETKNVFLLQLFFRTTLGYLISLFTLRFLSKIKAILQKVSTSITWQTLMGKYLSKLFEAFFQCRQKKSGWSEIGNNCSKCLYYLMSTVQHKLRWIHFLATSIKLDDESWGIYQSVWLCSPSIIRPLRAWITFCSKARCRWGFPSFTLATAAHRAQSQPSDTLLTYPHLDQETTAAGGRNSKCKPHRIIEPYNGLGWKGP